MRIITKRQNNQDNIKEAHITGAIREWLTWHRIFHWKQWQGLGSKKGVADIIGILPDGRFLAIEVKKPGGRLTELQKEFLNAVRHNNGVGIVAYSVDDVIEVLEPILRDFRKRATSAV